MFQVQLVERRQHGILRQLRNGSSRKVLFEVWGDSSRAASCGPGRLSGPPTGYQAPQQGYQAPQQGYQAPQAGYQAPQGAYQPQPQGAPMGAQAAPGLEENLACALCYALGLLTGIVFLVLAPYNQNKLIRFHAFQSIFFHVR